MNHIYLNLSLTVLLPFMICHHNSQLQMVTINHNFLAIAVWLHLQYISKKSGEPCRGPYIVFTKHNSNISGYNINILTSAVSKQIETIKQEDWLGQDILCTLIYGRVTCTLCILDAIYDYKDYMLKREEEEEEKNQNNTSAYMVIYPGILFIPLLTHINK